MNEPERMDYPPEKIAIIGGGFSGVMTAINLCRLSRQPLELTIINPRRSLARGVAYGTRRLEHLLNVAARNMSAFPDQPNHFLQWLQTRTAYDELPEAELREQFIPRVIYGEYLRGLTQQHLLSPAESVPVRTTFIEDEAVEMAAHDQGMVIQLANGGEVVANRVVLATGNEPPSALPGANELREHPGWVGNPWDAWDSRLPRPGGAILLLGTGLSTVDAVLTLRALGWQGVMHAVSRNGWLPKAHFRGIEYPDFPPSGMDLADLGLKKLLALVEEHCQRLRALETEPAIIVDKLRPHTQRIWQRFTLEERKEFARTRAAQWNVRRHRIAPQIHAQLTTLQLTGQLQLHAAGIECVRAEGPQLQVHLSGGKILKGDLVINATGPNTKFAATSSKLLQNLLRSGIIVSDDLEMGVRVAADYAVVGREGQRSEVLFALGPLLSGTLWESIAVPELRVQARRLAEVLLKQPATQAASPPPVMMEYMI